MKESLEFLIAMAGAGAISEIIEGKKAAREIIEYHKNSLGFYELDNIFEPDKVIEFKTGKKLRNSLKVDSIINLSSPTFEALLYENYHDIDHTNIIVLGALAYQTIRYGINNLFRATLDKTTEVETISRKYAKNHFQIEMNLNNQRFYQFDIETKEGRYIENTITKEITREGEEIKKSLEPNNKILFYIQDIINKMIIEDSFINKEIRTKDDLIKTYAKR